MATGWYSKGGSFTPTEHVATVTHDIGVIPDMIVVGSNQMPTTANILFLSGGLSTRMIENIIANTGESYPDVVPTAITTGTTGNIAVIKTSPNKGFEGDVNGYSVRNVTETTFDVGENEELSVLTGGSFWWVAFWCDGEIYGDGSVPTPLMLTSSINRGGYQVVDLANNEFVTGTAIQIPGIYALVDSNSKAVLLSGINLDGKTYNDLYVSMYKVDFKYTTKVYGKYVVIDENDNVIFQNDELTTTYIESEEDE